MPLQKLVFKPGVNRENTRYTQEGAWWDMDKVRFRSGTPEKIGGWTAISSAVFKGICRFLHNWTTLADENLMGIGTSQKFYIERGGLYYDITPIRVTAGPIVDPFTTGLAGSRIVTIHIVAHGATTGDYVTFSGAATVDGILNTTLNAEFQATYVDADHFTILATPCTAGGVTGGGAVVYAAFQLNTGATTPVVGSGWGVVPWGGSGTVGWGAASTTLQSQGMYEWVGHNFGQDLIYGVRDGGIYYWTAPPLGTSILTNLAIRGTALSAQAGASNAPTIADNILVTDDEYVIVTGTNAIGSATEDPMLVRWCDQGNPLNWTPAITNTAGDYRITAGSYTYAIKSTRQENLIWTDSALISMQSVGPPVVFSFTTLADNVSIASVKAAIVVNNVAYWMGKDKFYVYNGQVQTLNCDVRKYVFGGMNVSQLPQVHAAANNAFNEITWFYCSTSATTADRYVTYNYMENIWTFGSMDRTAWLDSPLRSTPMAASTNGKLYYHEVGFDDGSVTPPSAIPSYLESADFDIGDGQNFSFVQRILPDVDFDGSTAATPSVLLTLKSRDTPGSNFDQSQGSTVSQTATIPFSQFTNQCWVRVRGRQLAFRIESSDVGVTWQLGTPRLDLREDGQR